MSFFVRAVLCSGWAWGACSCLPRPAGGRWPVPARSVASSRRPCAPLWWLVGWLCVVAWLGFGAAAGSVFGALAHLVAGCVGPSVGPSCVPGARCPPSPASAGFRGALPKKTCSWRGVVARSIGTPPTGSPPKIVGGQTTPPRLLGCACLFRFGGAKKAFSCSVPLVLFGLPSRCPFPEQLRGRADSRRRTTAPPETRNRDRRIIRPLPESGLVAVRPTPCQTDQK